MSVTIEIDPEDLSEEVQDELEDDANIDKETAENIAEEIYLKNIETENATSSSVFSIIKKYINNLYLDINENRIGTIIDVQKSEFYGLVLKVDIGNQYKKLHLSTDSKELAQIVEYHNVNDVTELEGKNIAFKNERYDKHVFLIPKDINLLSNTRYKIYALQNHIYQKAKSVFNKFDNVFMTLFLVTGTITSIFGSLIISDPFGSPLSIISSLFVTVFGAVISYYIYLAFSFILTDHLEGSYYEMR